MRMVTAVLLVLAVGWYVYSGEDSEHFPYSLSALDSWVYDQDSKRDVLAGRVPTSYLARADGLASCRDLAINAAREHNFRRWGYVCCTVTSSTDCATKVR